MAHTEDCVANRALVYPGERCEPLEGSWDQPPGGYVKEAAAELGDQAPWCQVHRRAWELAEPGAAPNQLRQR